MSDKDIKILKFQSFIPNMAASEKAYALSVLLESMKDDRHPEFNCDPIEKLISMVGKGDMPSNISEVVSKPQRDLLLVQNLKLEWVGKMIDLFVANAYDHYILDKVGLTTSKIIQKSLVDARKRGIEDVPHKRHDPDLINGKQIKNKVCAILRVSGLVYQPRTVKGERLRVWEPDRKMWENLSDVNTDDAVTFMENKLELSKEEIMEHVR